MFAVWITTLSLLDAARGGQVCYKRLGCFTDNPPWSGIPERQLAGLPSPPEAVNTNFLLYTRDNIMKYQISATNTSTIKASNFQIHRKTRFIIHGHLAGADFSWITDMCRFMFHVEDVNCILTDWRGGSSGLYTEAVNNVRIVGAEGKDLFLTDKDYGYSPAKIHLIGHSLGAHAAGEAGRRKPGIGRITGLDPAGPLFQYTPTMVRLDPSDAKFVDIIHTHAGHLFFDFGILQTCGHLDFYPNGGKTMPGFNLSYLDFSPEYRSVGCGHKRSLQYYAESIITPNGFVGYQCETYRDFVSGACFPCPKEGCPLMGHYADKFSHKTGKEQQKVFLNTGPLPPYARKCSFWVLQMMLISKVTMNSIRTNTSLAYRNPQQLVSGVQHKIWSFTCVRNMHYQHYPGNAEIIIETDQLMGTSFELKALLNFVNEVMTLKIL
uniref:Triacylglycerol lipase n=1 Tax=Apteryx owenii TaxID=8824 RepID=A0A8B9NVC5_APTOW